MNKEQTMLGSKKKGSVRKLILFVVIFLVVAALVAIALPSFIKSRNTASQRACLNNMRLIDAGKEQWSMAAEKSAAQNEKRNLAINNEVQRK